MWHVSSVFRVTTSIVLYDFLEILSFSSCASFVPYQCASFAAARDATQVDFGKEDRVNASVYGADFKKSQPKVRKSKRRGTAVDFGSDVNHATSYNAEFAVSLLTLPTTP